MIKIDTRVKPETVEIIKETAKGNGRSFCGEIRFALEQYYKGCNHEYATCDIAGQFITTGGYTGPMFAKCTKCGHTPNPLTP